MSSKDRVVTESQDLPPGWHHDGQGTVRWWTGSSWQDAPPPSVLERIVDRLRPSRAEAGQPDETPPA